MKVLLVVLLSVFAIGCDQGAGKKDRDYKKKIETSALIFEHGIYTPVRKGAVLDSLESNTGKLITRSVLELKETTDRIPMIKGTYFAYRYRIENLQKVDALKPAVDIHKVVIYPKMTLPDGTTTTGWERTDKHRGSAGVVTAFDGYAFNEDYELVEGEWSFQIWYRGKMMVEQKFTTYQPEKSEPKPESVAPVGKTKT